MVYQKKTNQSSKHTADNQKSTNVSNGEKNRSASVVIKSVKSQDLQSVLMEIQSKTKTNYIPQTKQVKTNSAKSQ